MNSLTEALRHPLDQGGTLAERSAERPLLLVFLRHFGCTFCKEALADLAAARGAIEAGGTALVLVHLARPEQARPHLERYGLGGCLTVADPGQELYRAFRLRRGHLGQLLGWDVIRRGFEAMGAGHGVGPLLGDGLQLPGVFLVWRGEVVQEFRHRHAGERPAYEDLARCPLPSAR